MEAQPPKWADRFLVWYCNPDLLEEIQGDAHELYFERVRKEGKSKADLKYFWDVLRFCRWSNIRHTVDEHKPGYIQVLWNLNLKIAIRNALRNKLTFSIKTFGLSVCLAFALVVSAFVIQEYTTDHFHKDYERIFRVGSRVDIHGEVTNYAVSPMALRDGLEEEIPEVEQAFRFRHAGKPMFRIEDKVFSEETSFIACENFLKILSYNFIHGTSNALDEPNKILLTERTALKFFGDADAVGKTVDIGWTQLEVAAVIKNLPVNSHLQFDILVSWNTFDLNEGWENINAYTYFKLRGGTAIKDVEQKIIDLLHDHREDIDGGMDYRAADEIIISPIVENIADIQLSDFRDEDISVKRSKTNLNILIIVVILFLITGLINFHNISLAELTANVRKIGILKVFGGSSAKHSKVVITSTMLSVLAILPITILLVYISLILSERYLSIYVEPATFLSVWFWYVCGGFALAFIFSTKLNGMVLAGAADIISSLKGKLSFSHSKFQAREFLVAIQLSFSIVMLALISIIVDQFHYVNSIDKGFEDKNTIVIKLRSDDYNSALALQESLRKLSGVKNVDGGSFYLDNVETKEFFEVETNQGKKKMLVAYMNCGYNYLDVLGLKLVKGRNFMREYASDSFGSYIVNEAAAKTFGWTDPIGKQISGPLGTDREEGQIVGVIKDFNFASLHNKIEPLIIFPVSEGWGIGFLYVKVNPIRPQNIVSQIERAYKKIYPDLPCEWEYLDSKYASLYTKDYEVKNVFQVGLIISIAISCLGIFGMSSLLMIIRAKEMGIRKVVGAGHLQLFLIHMKTFVKFIFIAVVIGWPFAYYLSNHWLDNFAYHIQLNLSYFIMPCLLTLFIVMITSGYHGVKNALINPVDILKDE
jgi:putative ABC transport system permease protein